MGTTDGRTCDGRSGIQNNPRAWMGNPQLDPTSPAYALVPFLVLFLRAKRPLAAYRERGESLAGEEDRTDWLAWARAPSPSRATSASMGRRRLLANLSIRMCLTCSLGIRSVIRSRSSESVGRRFTFVIIFCSPRMVCSSKPNNTSRRLLTRSTAVGRSYSRSHW